MARHRLLLCYLLLHLFHSCFFPRSPVPSPRFSLWSRISYTSSVENKVFTRRGSVSLFVLAGFCKKIRNQLTLFLPSLFFFLVITAPLLFHDQKIFSAKNLVFPRCCDKAGLLRGYERSRRRSSSINIFYHYCPTKVDLV